MASFRGEKTKRRHVKRRINARQKDTIRQKRKDATRKEDKIKVSNGVFSHGVFSSFRAEISSFRMAFFVFSHGVISPFRMAFVRLFVFLHGVFRLFAAK